MLGIEPKITMHNIILNNTIKPVCQKIHKIHLNVALRVKEELEKILDAEFI